MIINPILHKELLLPYTGTRILQQDFGLIGTVVQDPSNKKRFWRVQALYAPIPERAIGGLRAKLIDDKDFISFINQMDLEVLLGAAQSGSRCRWSGLTYSDPEERDFCGLCCDEDDLVDDLYDRELLMRGESVTGMLPNNAELLRRVHLEDRLDVEESYILLWDADPETGISPDIRIQTVEKRWVRAERIRAPWEDV